MDFRVLGNAAVIARGQEMRYAQQSRTLLGRTSEIDRGHSGAEDGAK